MVAACTADPTKGLLGLPKEIVPLTLHSAADGPAIPGNTLLVDIQTLGSFEQPLIIKSKSNAGQGIGLTVGSNQGISLLDIEQSSSMVQIETKTSKLEETLRKLQETVNNYIQKAETIQISKLTIDKLQDDGFTLIAASVKSINDSEYQISEFSMAH